VVEESGSVVWWKSSHSSDGGGENCCEISFSSGEVRVRDSKLPDPEVLRLSFPAWRAAVAYFGESAATGGIHEHV